MLIDRYQRGEIKTKAELNVVNEIIVTWRSRTSICKSVSVIERQ